MDDEWDLQAVVRSCATSTEASVAVGDKTPVATDANDRPEKRSNESKLISISFDDGRSANDEQSVFSNFISFSMTPDADVNHARKRKSKNMKRVVVMREEEVSNDGWAWRKYGQKPIKNSPYPRNYYRCSTRKDCMARKRVERSLVDASSFIVTYYDNHKHPQPTHHISLAGTTKINKPSNMVATDLPEQSPCSSSSPASTSSFSPATSLKEDETEMNE